MNITHLVIDGSVAGGQLVALRLADAARSEGHDVRFLLPAGGRFETLLTEHGFPAEVVPLRGALDVAAMLRLRRLLRRSGADVLHTHGHFAVNVVGRVAGRAAGARVIGHAHADNVFRARPLARRAQILLDNATARLCRWHVAVSEHTRAKLIRQGYPAGRVVVIPNGVDVHDAEPASDLGDAAMPRLLTVGRLDEAKGYDDLLDALARLRHRDAIAFVAGEPGAAGDGYRLRLVRRATELGVDDRFRLLGHRDDMPELLAAADVVVVPSRAEAFGLAALEAMAAGRPVVAARVGGLPEVVVDGETGLLVPPHDPAALAEAIDALLDDPGQRARLGAAGRERARTRFAAAESTARILQLYAT